MRRQKIKDIRPCYFAIRKETSTYASWLKTKDDNGKFTIFWIVSYLWTIIDSFMHNCSFLHFFLSCQNTLQIPQVNNFCKNYRHCKTQAETMWRPKLQVKEQNSKQTMPRFIYIIANFRLVFSTIPVWAASKSISSWVILFSSPSFFLFIGWFFEGDNNLGLVKLYHHHKSP